MAELLNTKTLDTMSLSTEVASAIDISTFVNTTASDTLGGAKTYTDAEISALSADFNARIAALEGFTSFIGVKDSLPETAEDGQICIVGNKEYIYGSKADGSVGWTELGDTTAETAAIEELSNAVAEISSDMSFLATIEELESLANTKADKEAVESLANTKADKEAVESLANTKADKEAVDGISNTLATYGDIVTHNASEFDQAGSAAAAQEAAVVASKAYTDEQIAAVEGEISSLTDVVETKADQAAVDAAISAINENISTLSAKTEEDPVFTAWKDSTSIIVGKDAAAVGEYSNALGYHAAAVGSSSSALGNGASAVGEYSNAIGNSASANGYNSNAIGDGASASEPYSNALGGRANASAEGATQIGDGTNSVANSFQFMSTQIVDGNGKITTANLAGMDALKTAVSAIEEVTGENNVQVLREAVNTLVAAIKTFVGA